MFLRSVQHSESFEFEGAERAKAFIETQIGFKKVAQTDKRYAWRADNKWSGVGNWAADLLGIKSECDWNN